jgi:hypothetical protein
VASPAPGLVRIPCEACGHHDLERETAEAFFPEHADRAAILDALERAKAARRTERVDAATGRARVARHG